jgi:hypothetical protein
VGGELRPRCVPCGREMEKCCKHAEPCEGDLECMEYDSHEDAVCGSCGGLDKVPCPGAHFSFHDAKRRKWFKDSKV